MTNAIRAQAAAWMGGMALGFVATLAGAQSANPVPTWSGVYSAAQNSRGEEIHASVCAMCHGYRLNGAGNPEMPPSPAIAGGTWLRKWTNQSVAALFVYVRNAMPPDAPGTLTDQQTVDAIAHMLAISGMPAGEREMPPDPKALAHMLIQARPK